MSSSVLNSQSTPSRAASKMENQRENEKKISVRNQFFVAILANMPNMSYGLLSGWLSPAIPLLQSPEGPSSEPLSDLQISWIGAATTLGAMLGVVLYTWMADRFGRKTSLFCLSIPFSIGWSMKICSSEFYVLVTARFIAGMPSGANYVIIPLYIKEISDSSCRGILGTILTISLNTGVIAGYALGGYSDYQTNMWIYLSLPLLHMVLFFFFGLESPSFLVKQGRCEDAAKAIAWLNGLEISDNKVVYEVEEIKAEQEKAAKGPTVSFMSIVRNPATLQPLKVCLGLIIVHSLGGAFAVMAYASIIFQRADAGLDPNGQALVTGCIQMAGCLVTCVIVDKIGRKIILTLACIASFLSLSLLGVWFLLLDLGVELPGWIPLMAVCFCIFSYGLGTNPLPFVIISEVFDFQTRATLSGYILMYSWFNNSILLLGFKPLSNLLGMGAVFFMFALVNIFGSMLVIFRLPETKGKTVEEIQRKILDRKQCSRLPCYRK